MCVAMVMSACVKLIIVFPYRVMRQIFQSIKSIIDVLLLLLFIVGIFSLIGKCSNKEKVNKLSLHDRLRSLTE